MGNQARIEEKGGNRGSRENYMAAFFGGRPRFFFTLGSPPSPLAPSVAGGFGILGGRPLGRFGGGVSPLSSFFSCKSKTECQQGVLEGSGKRC